MWLLPSVFSLEIPSTLHKYNSLHRGRGGGGGGGGKGRERRGPKTAAAATILGCGHEYRVGRIYLKNKKGLY